MIQTSNLLVCTKTWSNKWPIGAINLINQPKVYQSILYYSKTIDFSENWESLVLQQISNAETVEGMLTVDSIFMNNSSKEFKLSPL